MNEVDLIDALNKGIISGAALDVFIEEPLSESGPFLDMENIILGSHNANNESKLMKLSVNTINNLKKS